MVDIEAARAEIQKVVAQLVSRFGHEHEVFAHLSLALDHLRESPPPRVIESVEPVPEPVAEEPAATEVEVEAPLEAELEEVTSVEEPEPAPVTWPSAKASPRRSRAGRK